MCYNPGKQKYGSNLMLEFLFGKKKKNPPKDVRINEIYTKLSNYYGIEKIPSERKKYLQNIMIKHGYLNYPYIKALEELTPAEILYALQFKWIDNHIFNDGKFRFDNNKISALAREIINRNKVPFYCTAWSNIRSVRNAIKSGFVPAWVEMTAKPAAVVDEMNL